MWHFFIGFMIGAISVKSVRTYNNRYYESFYISQENEIKKLKNLLLDKKIEDEDKLKDETYVNPETSDKEYDCRCKCNKSC
jgi:hypothetical protein